MRYLAATAALILATSPTVAFADVVSFAQYGQVQNSRALVFQENPTGPGGTLFSRANNAAGTNFATSYGATKTNFDILVDADNGDNIVPIPADFKFVATTTAFATKGTASFEQSGFSGAFSFIYTNAAPVKINGVTYHTSVAGTLPHDTATDKYLAGGLNLLSGTFSEGVLAGILGGSSGGIFDNAVAGVNLGNIQFNSDIFDFTALGALQEKDFSLTLTAANPRFQVMGGATDGDLKSFTATSTGSFSADPQPTVNAAVPEMATWGMMVMGFGLIGGTIRSRRIGAGIRLPVRQAEFA